MAKKIRVLTVAATGKRYLVTQLDFRANKAHCWGELVSFKGLASKHEGQKSFLLSAVTIADVDHTPQLLRELFDQRTQGLRDAGHEVTQRTTRRGNVRVTDHGTPAQQEQRRRETASLREALGPLFPSLEGALGRAAARGGVLAPYREPSVTQGPDMPIPEARPEVLEKIVARVTEEGAFLQRYSNGEFTSSSLAVGLTLEACKGVQVLETPGYTVHFDRALGLYWRQGGCWD